MSLDKDKNARGAQWSSRAVGWLLSFALVFTAWPQTTMLAQDTQAPPAAPRGPEYATKTPEELQQLVAPIALYPDSLVAQILSAATFPEQVVEADRWAQAHPDLKNEALAQAVDRMNWDPSVKALTAFPSALGNMDKNISWTSALGDAYYNQQRDVMGAVQAMRQKAEQAGNLKTTPATCGNDAGFDHHYSTRGTGCRLRACVQSVDSVRATDRGVAGMVSVSGHVRASPKLKLKTASVRERFL